MTNSGKEFLARSFLTTLCLRNCGPWATRNFSAFWPSSFLMECELMLAIWSTSPSVGIFLLLLVLELWSSPVSVDNDLIGFSFSQTGRVETFLGRYFPYVETFLGDVFMLSFTFVVELEIDKMSSFRKLMHPGVIDIGSLCFTGLRYPGIFLTLVGSLGLGWFVWRMFVFEYIIQNGDIGRISSVDSWNEHNLLSVTRCEIRAIELL